jgi:hypothetical protein
MSSGHSGIPHKLGKVFQRLQWRRTTRIPASGFRKAKARMVFDLPSGGTQSCCPLEAEHHASGDSRNGVVIRAQLCIQPVGLNSAKPMLQYMPRRKATQNRKAIPTEIRTCVLWSLPKSFEVWR